MNIDVYQERALETKKYPEDATVLYPALALCEEAGEVAGKIAKALRKGGQEMLGLAHGETHREEDIDPDLRKAVLKEMGDVLWQLSVLAWDMGYRLSEVAEDNLAKLKDRAARGVIVGEGDNR